MKLNEIYIPWKTIIVVLLFAGLAYMCTNMFRTKELSEKEKQTIPYKGNEVLIFKSNKDEIDTLKLDGIIINSNPPNFGEIFWARNTQSLIVRDKGKCQTCGGIITLEVQNYSSETNIYFDLELKNKDYYHSTSFQIFEKLKPHKLVVNSKIYNDVVFIENSNSSIDRICWSISKGIVRIDLDKKYYWELI